ncbi:MAG: LacI family DNA-binding transcriptional regulator [Stackebrandtia sp.]
MTNEVDVAPGGRVGIADVAKRAGVSVTTVSHVLSSRRPVAEATRVKVMQVIEELDYRPNEVARSMRAQRTLTIGFVVPDIGHPFYTAAARGLQDALRPDGYHCIVTSTDSDREVELETVRQLLTRVDGVVISGSGKRMEDLQPILDAKLPLVLLDADIPGPGFDVVTNADYESGAVAAQHLVDTGHRRIAFITGPEDFGAPARRVEGYRSVLDKHGIPAEANLVVRSPATLQGGAQCMATLINLAEPPDAVIAITDVVAVGAMYAARDQGLSIPDDVAVMGFDDIEAASLVAPTLTTMGTASREHGQSAGELILRRINDSAAEPQRVVFPARLIRRESA